MSTFVDVCSLQSYCRYVDVGEICLYGHAIGFEDWIGLSIG